MSNDKPHMHRSEEPVKITPAMAREWLAIQPDFQLTPRSIRQRNVSKILRAINNGEWRVTHQGIALAPNGFVLDGRHRLTAIASQRKHVPCYVDYDCDPDDFAVMDTGAGRSPGDALKTAGYKDVNVLSAATRQVIAYPEIVGTASTLGSVTNNLINTDILNALEDPVIGKAVEEAARSGYAIANGVGRYGLRTSATVLAAVIAMHSNFGVDSQDEFVDKLGSGEGLNAGSPILAMRRWLITPSAAGWQKISGTYRPTAFLAVGIRAWNDYASGSERQAISYRPGHHLMPEVD